MNAKIQDQHPPRNAEQVNDSLYGAVKDEVQHEVAHMRDSKTPVDPTQSDVLVQKHVNGLVMTLFALVAVILLAAITIIALHGHS
ncbi:hypothetical protein [Acidicapsa ligni]|uniref:hypothetical protein n=1 Tax=Acidicapsa ligni TaxID=542300 RepID=UPI0021E0CD39|nr:hypothetical protein [Acidicapsa ligni]